MSFPPENFTPESPPHKSRIRRKRLVLLLLLLAGGLALSSCGSLASIPYTPLQTPQAWLQSQPFVDVHLGTVQFILVQPSSTVFVYLLGSIGIGAGISLVRDSRGQRSRKWWGIALLLWGAGALAAGTSYQAFSYQIKCAGRPVCSWTSWWEIAYLILSGASIDAMLISVAYSSCRGICRNALRSYAVFAGILYTGAVLIGAFTLQEFLISFELLLLTAGPNILLLFILNLRGTLRDRNPLERRLAVTWIWLGGAITAYYLYLISGLEEVLWKGGIWFSANDVLHLGLISWFIFIIIRLTAELRDQPGSPSSSG